MKKVFHRIFLALTLMSLLSVTGCVVAAVAAGAGGYAFIKGKSEKNYNATLDEAKSGVRSAFKALSIQISSQKGDSFSYTYKGMSGAETPVTVGLESITAEVTKVSVRYGQFGDEEKNLLFLKELDKYITPSK